MAVMLRREELVRRRERSIDFPDVKRARRCVGVRVEVRRKVAEGDDGLTLRERGERERWKIRDREAYTRQTEGFQNVAPRRDSGHPSKLLQK